MPGSSRDAGVARGIPAWYRVPAKTHGERGREPQHGGSHPQPQAPTAAGTHLCTVPEMSLLLGCSQGSSVGRGWPGAWRVRGPTRRLQWRRGKRDGIQWVRPQVCRIWPWAERCWVPRAHQDLPGPRGPAAPPAPQSVWGRGNGMQGGACPHRPTVPTPVGSHLLRSSSVPSRGSDADLRLFVSATPGATLPRTGGLGSLWRGQCCCHHPDLPVSPQASPRPTTLHSQAAGPPP